MKQEVTSKKVFIRTLGCQMNVRDSEVICGLLKKEGYQLANEMDKADIVLFNTCSVRQHAEDKVWSEIGRIGKLCPPRFAGVNLSRGTTSPERKIIGLVGCMAQNYKESIFQRAPAVDFVVGPADIDKIPEILSKLLKKWGQSPKYGDSPHFLYETKIWETDGEVRPQEIYHTGFYEDKEHTFVVISEGCSNFCSYCVVPYVRGAIRHRDYEDILKEIEEAIDNGITKITLLGQNVNAYECKNGDICLPAGRAPKKRGQSPFSFDFIRLLEMVNQVKDLKEFSFITSHPKDTSIDLFKAMADLDKLKKYLHLPAQSGSDRILKLMNRGYTKKFYLELADNYRKIVKDGALTTDIIVGFPTETEEDFQDTYNLIKDVAFDAAYIFKYSPRPHTEAEKLIDDVPKQEKEKRHRIILELQRQISRDIAKDKQCRVG